MGTVDRKKQVLTYPIASGTMCYAAENERTIYLQCKMETGFNLYGQIAGGGQASCVNLAEVLLEFAMTWNAPGDPSEAHRQMQNFGGRIGEALGTQSAAARPVNSVLACAAVALGRLALFGRPLCLPPHQRSRALPTCPKPTARRCRSKRAGARGGTGASRL
jgi:hypothetical protein